MQPQFSICASSQVFVDDFQKVLPSLLPSKRIIYIVDSEVLKLYPEFFQDKDLIAVSAGENQKNLKSVERIVAQLIEMGADRQTFLLGVGGGVVTDMVGFVASIYMRGVEFGFVSTTLLGQVDASVGGKNGVNFEDFKNMIGCFSQPRFVVCDPRFLSTLPIREFRAGMAEVVKVAIIGRPDLFSLLEENSLETLRQDSSLLKKVISAAIQVKAEIVSRDEKESGERRLLNLGHTLGHALEKCSHSVNHGEAVAVGLKLICDLSLHLHLLPTSDSQRIISLLEKFGFDLQSSFGIELLLQMAEKDKKNRGGEFVCVMPLKIGKCEVRKFSKEQLLREFQMFTA